MWPSLDAEPPPELPLDASAAGTRELTFGFEEPRESHLVRNLALAAAVVLIVAGVGYASWSWDVRDGVSLAGSVPPAPARDLGIAPPPPMPSAEEIEQLFQMRRVPPPTFVDDPQFPGTPEPPAPPVVPTFSNP
jgi:hypothetical protein